MLKAEEKSTNKSLAWEPLLSKCLNLESDVKWLWHPPPTYGVGAEGQANAQFSLIFQTSPNSNAFITIDVRATGLKSLRVFGCWIWEHGKPQHPSRPQVLVVPLNTWCSILQHVVRRCYWLMKYYWLPWLSLAWWSEGSCSYSCGQRLTFLYLKWFRIAELQFLVQIYPFMSACDCHARGACRQESWHDISAGWTWSTSLLTVFLFALCMWLQKKRKGLNSFHGMSLQTQ